MTRLEIRKHSFFYTLFGGFPLYSRANEDNPENKPDTISRKPDFSQSKKIGRLLETLANNILENDTKNIVFLNEIQNHKSKNSIQR
ncbi:hypothetical protein LEP1GSC171_1536 [Leptospira santarosai str. HAI1380]|uniref:Uncharacterized protein n=1 Tax=Leptospira santarosai serovar Arenal str. MAVJ 401 TaxID=1049976 RepID=M6JTB7_9LEPT|nr:hypothetical protein LEP1GSC040_2952 [Leptospira santarosai str. 2000030832]EMM85691.1 hypothetical protein LEP1GSC039_1784 [Leptospira santarosai str. 2000027870]EMN22805.1 hypothetical protein LEP1GSC063_1834 [Leptospira santarosai serovar Arenal str. MAVJ 401]EMO16052.1 hypothetical protein LEP1GSC165_3142 [Leptospira santarosai str. CBC523]EMO32149.1 hypothetical protein LEP1GSC175_3013 [Leptospira santarosai str. HAI821]EMO71279.1 hypothetical protein LEP1GSC130_1173 [Leptospira santar